MIRLLSIFMPLLIFGITSVASTHECWDVEGYYWRDYNGDIPTDALPSGTDVNGKPVYIGQVFDKYATPAKILTGDKKAYYEHGGLEHAVTQNIKIFCTQHPEQFEWIRTSNDDIKLITDRHLVIGGYAPGCTTYIGRIRSGGEVLVGKALADTLPEYAGLHIPQNGKGTKHIVFDVLAYNYNLHKNGLRRKIGNV